ncbi:MAG: PKD domain-containing protein, partial [Methanoregula sp.]|nr:PKD domain-containing protein [Methanoregula sp.]
ITTDVPAPVAAFSGTPTSGSSPLSVQFTDESTNVPMSWSWDFGDGNATSHTLKNPVHLYTDGTYTVTLTATNAGGSSTVTRTGYIMVGPQAPVANFIGTPLSGNPPFSVQFMDTSTNTPTAWSWSFGDGSSATTQNPLHTYQSVGYFPVTLTATNSVGTRSLTRPNYIQSNATIVSSVSGTGGSISPSGTVFVAPNSSPTFAIMPTYGYTITTVTVDGVSQGPVSSYTFSDVKESHTITATFAKKSYTITASAGTGGTISPSGSVSVTHGGDQPFTITRNPYYHISSVLVDDVSNGTISSYTFSNVTAPHTISATFAANTRDYILFDNFEYTPERTLTGWTTTGTVTKGRNNQRNGSYSVELQGANSPASSMTRAISTSGNSSVIVKFSWATRGFESGESLIAEYSTNSGSSWSPLTSIGNSVTLLTPYTATLSAADDNANFQLRFRISANRDNEYGYIDDVWVSGILI